VLGADRPPAVLVGSLVAALLGGGSSTTLERTGKMVARPTFLAFLLLLVSGCASNPPELQYRGNDAVVIVSRKAPVGGFLVGSGANTRIIDVNGVRRSQPYPPGDESVSVPPGPKVVGLDV
jgi:hypothetical protein